MKQIKKYISLLLAVLMLLTSVPLTALADERVDQSGGNDTVSWTYTASTDTLYMNGESIYLDKYGTLPTYKDDKYVDITFSHLVIGKDVKEITSETYLVTVGQKNTRKYKYKQPFDITFEEGIQLKEFGGRTFLYSTVTSIVFPDSLEVIKNYSFNNCTMLENVVFGAGLKEIERDAFLGSAIKEVTLPQGLTSIGTSAFSNCTNLEKINFAENAEKLEIGESAFAYTAITELTVPAYISALNYHTFGGCSKLEEVNFEVKETENGLQGLEKFSDAFYGSAITSLTFPETVTDLQKVRNMSKLKSVDISKAQITKLTNYMFEYDSALTDIKMPQDITEIGNYVFSKCTALETIDIPDSVTTIGEYVFSECSSLSSVDLPDSLIMLDDYAFSNCSSLSSIDLPESLITIGSSAFNRCTSLKSIEIPDSVLSILSRAFYYCTALEYAKLPSKLTYLSDATFGYCSNLSEVVMPPNLRVIDDEAFYYCPRLNDLKLPDTVEKIGEYAFYRCYSIFDLPANLKTVESYAFTESSIRKAVFQNPVVLEDHAFANASYLYDVVFMDGSGSNVLEDYVFYGCRMLYDVNIPANIKRIDQGAFQYCSNLTKVTFDEGSQLQSIEKKAFASCVSLPKITLPSTVQTIGDEAFSLCKQLSSINLQDTQLTQINSEAFDYTALEKVTFPDTLTTIKSKAFYGSKLKSLELPEKIAGFTADRFEGCPITKVTVYNPNFNFYDNTFSGADTTIVGYRGSTAALFAGENGMTFIALESGNVENPGRPSTPDVPKIPTYGTYNGGTWIVTSDKELVISGNGAIGSDTAYDNSGNDYTFAKIASLNDVKKVIICDGITSIPDKFLYGTKFLSETEMTVTLPETLTSIGKDAFKYTALSYIDIPDSVTSIGDYAFYEAGLKGGVKLSNSLATINQYAFANNGFTSVVIPDSVTAIELAAFNNCKNLSTMYIPDTVTAINEGALTTRPIGFTSAGKLIDGFTIECKLNSRAYQYAYSNNINIKLDIEGDCISGYYSSKSCAKWYYYPESKEFYFVSNGVQPSNNVFYYSDGTVVNEGELDVDNLIVCFGVTNIKGVDGISVFKVLNPEVITLPKTLYTIGDNAFTGLTNFKSVKIPDSVTEISDTAFDGCSIEAIAFGTGIRVLPDYLFKDNKTLKHIDLNGVHTVGKGTFQNCAALEEIVIPYFLTKIQESAFAKCLNVKSVKIESGQQLTIYEKAFADLPFCDTVIVERDLFHYGYVDEDGKHHANSAKYLDCDNAAKTVFRNLGTSTTGVSLSFSGANRKAELAMFNGKNIAELNIGNNIGYIYYMEDLSELQSINVDENNETYFSYDGCLYEYDDAGFIKLIKAPANIREVDIYPGTRWIDSYAFYGSKIEHIEIPEGVTLILYYAFANCTELRKITLPKTLQAIYDHAFENCSKLKIVDIPSVHWIGISAFENCTNLASILLPDNISEIQPLAFSGCTALTGIVAPNNDYFYLSNEAFENCTSLTDVYLWNNYFENETFLGCDNVVIRTLKGSDSYVLAMEYGLNCITYTDENVFADECEMMKNIYEGYLGFCADGHGDIQYLTVYEPTCEQDGYIIGVCEYCSVLLEEEHIDAPGHDYQNVVSIPATSTTNGVEKYTCTNCGDTYANYTPAFDPSAEKTLCQVTGSAVIANSKTADSGVTPLKAVSVKINDETVATTDSNGDFSFSLETGVYELVLSYNYGFDRTVYLVVKDEDIDIGAVPIIACDWNKDGKINDDDLKLFRFVISSKYGDASYLDYVDMNNDGCIDVKDLVYMNNVKGLDSSTFTYPTIVIGA
ncbi:MAG: leucine-rich repeat protein [Eubacterium sp.]|nr:leucine-rich repeat protein [Eubacterium sp.]